MPSFVHEDRRDKGDCQLHALHVKRKRENLIKLFKIWKESYKLGAPTTSLKALNKHKTTMHKDHCWFLLNNQNSSYVIRYIYFDEKKKKFPWSIRNKSNRVKHLSKCYILYRTLKIKITPQKILPIIIYLPSISLPTDWLLIEVDQLLTFPRYSKQQKQFTNRNLGICLHEWDFRVSCCSFSWKINNFLFKKKK